MYDFTGDNKGGAMKFLKIAFVLGVVTFINGCAAPKYDGPGSFQDFANARYQCLNETSARVSSATVNQYGGTARSQVIPSCSAMLACLASKGYYQSQNGRFDASSIPVQCT